jgi:hypothetical protein
VFSSLARVAITVASALSNYGCAIRGITFIKLNDVAFQRHAGLRDDAKAGRNQILPDLGINFRTTPLLHQRFPVGGGPSLKTWPWWPPQRAQ